MNAIDRESYDELYRSAPAVWSGRPNRQVVVEAGALRPGAALDAGSGEGGDALWLAERGWRVTAVDFSAVALERAAAQAAARGLTGRIEFLHADLATWAPPEGRFDLVTAHYLHASWADRPALFGRLAAAVAPGGTLLVVGHLLGEHGHGEHGHGEHGHGEHGHGERGHGEREHGEREHGERGPAGPHEVDPGAFYSAEDVAAVLDRAEWHDVVAETRDRDQEAAERTGNAVPDTVLVARRRSGTG